MSSDSEERCSECQLRLRPPDQADIEYTRDVVSRMDPQEYRYRFCVGVTQVADIGAHVAAASGIAADIGHRIAVQRKDAHPLMLLI